MVSPDILVITSLDPHNQQDLAKRFLGKHEELSHGVERKTDAEGTLHLESAFEILQFTLKNHQALTVLMSSVAVGAGLKVGGVLGKMFETVAVELAKDAYLWLKASIQGALQDSKKKDSQLPEEYRLGELRIIIRGVLLDRAPFVAHIYNRYAKIHSYEQLPYDDDEVTKRASEFFGFVLPFVTHLLLTQPGLIDQPAPKLQMSSDVAARDVWRVRLPHFVSFEILNIKQINVQSPSKKEEKLIRKSYQKFLDESSWKSSD